MTQDEWNFAIRIVQPGGIYLRWRNGSGHKGVRFKDFKILFELGFSSPADPLWVINSLISSKRVVAIMIDREQSEYDLSRGRSHIRAARVVRIVGKRNKNPMLYMSDNVPNEVQKKLSKRAR